MKKLLNRKFNFSFMLEENQVYEIVIENPSVLAEIVKDLTMQSDGQEGEFILSEADKILPIEKNIVFVRDLFALDVNQRKILAKLYTDLSDYAKEMLTQEKMNFLQAYIQYMDYICGKSNLFLLYDDEPDYQEILKLGKVKIDMQTGSLLEQIVEYIKVFVELLHQNIFIFLNLKFYLTREELEKLYCECFHRKVQIVLIESVFQKKILEEKVCIIDKDKCIIYL